VQCQRFRSRNGSEQAATWADYNDEVQICEVELSIFKRDLDIANNSTRQHKPLNWLATVP